MTLILNIKKMNTLIVITLIVMITITICTQAITINNLHASDSNKNENINVISVSSLPVSPTHNSFLSTKNLLGTAIGLTTGVFQGLDTVTSMIGLRNNSLNDLKNVEQSAPLVEELEYLHRAFTFSVEKYSKKNIKKEIQDELDKILLTELGSTSFEKLSANKKELEHARLDKIKKGASCMHKGNTNYQDEIDFRQHQYIYKELLDAKRGEDVLKNISYNLSATEVPYGGYFFPDNYGGISRRWNEGGISSDILGYKTLYEIAEEEVKEEIKNRQSKIVRTFNGIVGLFKKDNTTEYQKKQEEKKIHHLTIKRVKEKLSTMTEEQFQQLSPIEKYDIMLGNFDFPATVFEKNYKGKRRISNMEVMATLSFSTNWEGRCNADRACGICNRKCEPIKSIQMNIPEIKRKLTYFPLDIKALLMATYFSLKESNYAQLGSRRESLDMKSQKPNMGTFDILLRSLFLKHKVPFVINNHNDDTVNNVSVIGFDRKIKEVRALTKEEQNEFKDEIKHTIANCDPHLYNNDIIEGSDSWKNPKKMYKKGTKATKIMRVETNLKLLTEVTSDHLNFEKVNKPTKELIANATSKTENFIKDDLLVYDLYLTDDNEIVEGKYISGDLGFAWFAGGEGDEENRIKCHRYLKYDLLKKLASASALPSSSPSIDLKNKDNNATIIERLRLSNKKLNKIKDKIEKDKSLPDEIEYIEKYDKETNSKKYNTSIDYLEKLDDDVETEELELSGISDDDKEAQEIIKSYFSTNKK
ncbi:MAG: hypothetical protein HQK49_19995 [Oligoflexia bacterium]|nr:hypothetical protein [Oligoflexia bacterium]